jgi:type IV secretory pathway VirB4 component
MRDVLEDLAARLHNFTGNGPYAYLTDRPTTIPQDAPLVVFDTRSIPEHFAGAAMIEIVEHISSRAQASHEQHIQAGAAHGEDAYIVSLEECWKLMEREATGRWITELPRRSRHLRLGVIGVSQQFSDFDNAWGRALIENASQTITFKQSLRQIELMRTELGLSREETHTISQHVKTVKREYATAYWVNGPRGRGAITVSLSPLEYWTATHDPEHDEPIRQLALAQAGGDPWRALRLLADPAWHQQLTETRTR